MTHKKRRIPAAVLALFLVLGILAGCAGRTPDPNVPLPSQTETESPETLPDISSEEAQKAQSTFEDLCKQLFTDQVTQSYLTLHYTLKDPAAYGITDYDISFGDFSREAMEQAHKEQENLYQQINSIDPALLLDNQKLTYRILMKSLEYEQEAQGLELYYEPLVPSSGIQSQLPVLLTEYAFYDKEDVEHYLTLLSDIDRYFEQILAFEKERSAAGLFMTDTCADEIISQAQPYLLSAEHNLMGTEFNAKIDAMEGLNAEEKKAFKEQNQQVVTEHFIPAYKALLEGLVKYWYVCRWMQGSAVKLKTYCIWWSVPAAVIAGGCLLHLQHSALAMLLAAGGTFAFGLVCELRPGGCLHGYWKGLKKKFEKT